MPDSQHVPTLNLKLLEHPDFRAALKAGKLFEFKCLPGAWETVTPRDTMTMKQAHVYQIVLTPCHPLDGLRLSVMPHSKRLDTVGACTFKDGYSLPLTGHVLGRRQAAWCLRAARTFKAGIVRTNHLKP